MLDLATATAALALLLMGGIAGVFYAYSVSVMPALDAVDADTAVRTMRSINRAILNRAFFASFLGAPLASVATGALMFLAGEAASALLSLLAAVTYTLGAFVPTAAINVPLNQALDASTGDPALVWSRFHRPWTRSNTVRAVASAVALLLLVLALLQPQRES